MTQVWAANASPVLLERSSMKEHYSASATALALHASLAAWHASDASRLQSIVNLGLRVEVREIQECVARYR